MTIQPQANPKTASSRIASGLAWLHAWRMRLAAPSPRVVTIIVWLTSAYFIYPGVQVNADSHLYLTVSIVDRGTLNIDPFAQPSSDISAWHGHYYSDKAPGLSLLATPLYVLLKLILLHGSSYLAAPTMAEWVRYGLAVGLAAVPTGAVSWLLYKMLERMSVTRGWCAGLALTYGLGTIARPFATLFFSHQLSTLFCFGAFALAFLLRREQLDRRFALAVGLLLGYALITEYPSAIAGAAIATYVVTIPHRGRSLGLLMGVAALPPLAVAAVYNTLCFGNPLRIGYANLAGLQTLRQGQAQGFFGVTYPHLDALWGITFSQYRGLFFLSPVLLLAVPGCLSLMRRIGWRAEGVVCAWVMVGFLLFNASYFAWDGGASMGPRQALISIPFFVLPIGELVRRHGQSRPWRRISAVLAAYSIAMVELSAAVSPLFSGTFSPLTQWVLPRLAGMRVDPGHPSRTAHLIDAFLRQTPWFLGAQIESNWGQMLHLPGLTQLYPLVSIIGLLLLWPRVGIHVMAAIRALWTCATNCVQGLCSAGLQALARACRNSRART